MQMGLSQMPPGMMPPVGLMPPPPMTVDGGDFMAMQLPPGMPAMPSSARPGWPGTSVPVQGMGSGCSAPMVSSIPSDHSAPGQAFQHHSMAGGGFPHVPGRGEPKSVFTISIDTIASRVSFGQKVISVYCSSACRCWVCLTPRVTVHMHHDTCPAQLLQSVGV